MTDIDLQQQIGVLLDRINALTHELDIALEHAAIAPYVERERIIRFLEGRGIHGLRSSLDTFLPLPSPSPSLP